MINFLKGQPSLELLPVDMFKKANELALSEPNARFDMLQYGIEYGTDEFRNNLANFLSKEYQLPVQSKNVCPTTGASFGLQHVISLLTRPESITKYCYFQDPTYFLVFDIYKDIGFQPHQFVGIRDKNNEEGLDVDYFETILNQHFPDINTTTIDSKKDPFIYNAVLYCVPTHANPTGSILPEHQRQKLVQLGRKYNVLIICDDVYDILTFTNDQQEKVIPPKRVVAYDLEESHLSPHQQPCVISNGSFSKILAPGCRLGWLEAHETLIEKLAACGSYISGGTPSNYMNQLVNQMLKASEESDINIHVHIEKLAKELKQRLHQGIWEPIQKELIPLGCQTTIDPPKGGYFLWLKLPKGIVCQDIQQIIKKHQLPISFGNTNIFKVPTNDNNMNIIRQVIPDYKEDKEGDTYIRLCFAHYPIDQLQFGIQQLTKAIQLSKEEKNL